MASAVRRISISTGYEPRQHQAAVHAALKRFNVLVAHRRFGKTVLCVNQLVDRALRCTKQDPRFAYIAPLRNQSKDVAWEYLKRYTRPIIDAMGPESKRKFGEINEAELRVDLPGGRRIRLYGADNPDALRGIYLDGVVFDEFAQMQPRIWSEVIRPALVDRNGWAIFIGTPMGRNAFHRLYEEAKTEDGWHAMMFRASETGIVPQLELDASAKAMTPEQYAQEFECSFEAAIVGAYYGTAMALAEKEKRITSVPWEPKVPVITAWDLGISNATAIWFVQQVGQEIRVIDYICESGKALPYFAGEILERKSRGWAFAEHLLPHDAEVKELGTGKSRVETLQGLGINPRVLPASSIDDGINAVRLLLPRCWFDKARCATGDDSGVEALRQYRTEWDDKRKVFHNTPLHDWTSDPADAFRILAMGLRPASKTAFDRKIVYAESKVA